MTDEIKPKRQTIMTREVIIQLPKMREQGMTNADIAKNLGVSYYTIGYWMKRLKGAGYEVPRRIFRGGFHKVEL